MNMYEDLNEDGYPTESALENIRTWDYTEVEKLMEYVQTLWKWENWGSTIERQKCKTVYHISTGGWSGNEDIIHALRENHMFWSLYWVQSSRGGHYIFEIRNLDC